MYLQRDRLARVVWTSPEWQLVARDPSGLTITASLYRASGRLVGAYSVTTIGQARTFTAGANPMVVTTSGELVEWGDDGYDAEFFAASAGGPAIRVRAVRRESATEWELDAPVPAPSGSLYPASFRVDIPAADLDFVETHARIEWVVTSTATGEARAYQQAVHVGRTLFAPAMDAQRVKEYGMTAFPHATANRPEAWYHVTAKRASERVERRVLASGRFPNLFGDSGLFADAGLAALRLELAFEGLVPAAFDPQQFQQQQEDELTRQLEYAIAQQWHDENANGKVDANEFRSLRSIPMRLT